MSGSTTDGPQKKELGVMTRLVTIEQLLEKPICMMSGEEFFCFSKRREATGKGTCRGGTRETLRIWHSWHCQDLWL